MLNKISCLTLLVALAQATAGCGSADDSGSGNPGGTTEEGTPGGSTATGTKDIVDTAVAAGSFKKLAGALTAAGLVDALKAKGPFTVFAPTDDAFDRFEKENPGVLGKLTKDELTNILKYHVVAGAAVKSTDLKDGDVVTTLSGSPALVSTMSGVQIDDANVIKADIVASNGVIHVIDQIILPPKDDIVGAAVAAGSFKTLTGALMSAGLVSALQGPGPFTVFAPTDDAFKKLSAVPAGDALKNVLLYHVVSGAVGSGNLKPGSVPTLLTGKSVTVDPSSGVKIDDAKVTKANLLAKNGVIHVIDTVLVPK